MRLSVWINAFIPKNVPDYTVTLKAGPHTGKTAIPLPSMARVHPFNTFKAWNAGYLSDQRSFDSDPAASVRMQSLAELELGNNAPAIVGVDHHSSGTTEVDLESGDVKGFARADMSRCSFSPLRIPVTTIPQRTLPSPLGPIPGPVFPRSPFTTGTAGSFINCDFDVKGQAGDPLVWAAADIDYTGTFSVSFNPTSNETIVSFDGFLDEFPAFEAYAKFGSATQTLFTSSPPKGHTVTDLLGPAKRPISGKAHFK